MSRALLLTAAAVLAVGAAQAQTSTPAPADARALTIDPARRISAMRPVFARFGDLIVSDISEAEAGKEGAEYFYFVGRAGQTVSAQVQSDIPTLEVQFRVGTFPMKLLAQGPAKDKPLTLVLPKDGYYYLVVSAQGAQRQGSYRLAFGADGEAPALAAGAAQPAQVSRVVVQNHNTNSTPFFTRPGELVAGEITPDDMASGVDRSADSLYFQGRAGEAITAQVRSDIPSLLVAFRLTRSTLSLKPLAEGSGRDAPVRYVLPKDDTYEIAVHTQGPQRYGKYLLSIGTAEGAPPLDPPQPKAVQIAEAPKPPPAPEPPPKPATPPVTPTPQLAVPKPAEVQAAAPMTPKASAPATSGPPPLPQIPGVINARPGQTLSRPAAAKPGPATEMFQFLAAGGSDLQFTASGSGKLMLILYTIDGEEIVSASGADILRLDAIAPRDDLYFLSVWRADAAKPYRVNLVEKEVEAVAASVRYGVGFEDVDGDGEVVRVSCWAQPGVKQRRVYPDGRVVFITYLGDGRVRSETSYPDKPAVTAEWTVSRDGEDAIQTFSTGRSIKYRPFDRRFGAYRGYLCQ